MINIKLVYRLLLAIVLLGQSVDSFSHPLRLSLCEIEYTSSERFLTINLKLFLTDVNEALVFDPNSTELAFCTPNESERADPMLLEYLDQFFYVMINGEKVDLKIKSKRLSGEGDNTALAVFFEYQLPQSLTSMEIKNAVFTDLFFDQSNIVYVHIDEEPISLMLNKKTPTHKLTF
ncbi:MAG: DUF6702 family protein [Bacteroidota bacterium]